MTSTLAPLTAPVQVAPGLVLGPELHRAAATGVATHTPELPPLTAALFTSPEWTLVPDENTGRAYKAELVLARTETRTVKLNLWLAPDLRAGDDPKPHNHPWDFVSYVLTGYYREHRWMLRDGLVVHEPDVQHLAGDRNKIGREVFHEVVDVGTAGSALSLMVCGPGMSGWGYLDPDSGEFTPATLPAGFEQAQRALNPHQQAG